MLSLKDLHDIYEAHHESYDAPVKEFGFGQKHLAFNSQPAILGVVNLSTDSWYKNSICYSTDQAIRRSRALAAQGADIIDIGSESTDVNAARVDDFKQTSQVIPVLEVLRKDGILTSVETYYPAVARACLDAGANVINLTGGESSDEIYKSVAEHDAGIIICYVQAKNAREVGEYKLTSDPVGAVYEYFEREIERATSLGVEKIFLDPGMGFAYQNFSAQNKSLRIKYQIDTLLNSFRLKTLGYPICNIVPTSLECFGDEFRSSQAFTAVLGILGRSGLLRTHEAAKVKGVIDTLSLF